MNAIKAIARSANHGLAAKDLRHVHITTSPIPLIVNTTPSLNKIRSTVGGCPEPLQDRTLRPLKTSTEAPVDSAIRKLFDDFACVCVYDDVILSVDRASATFGCRHVNRGQLRVLHAHYGPPIRPETDPCQTPSPGPWTMMTVAGLWPTTTAHQWVTLVPPFVPHHAPRVFPGIPGNAWASGTVAFGPPY